LKILIAPDKFKGSLSAEQVCVAISKGLKKYSDVFKVLKLPVADGGDGSLDVLSKHFLFQENFVEVLDPLMNSMQSSYLTDETTAYVELAKASGLALIDASYRNPMLTSSKGTGKLIYNALEKGYRHIVLMLGGSSTNDAGIGIAEALGFTFFDKDGNELCAIGKNLIHIETIKKSKNQLLNNVKLDILCDVKNPMFGSLGAFGVDVSKVEGGGAAGAISAGLLAMLDGRLLNGFEFISSKLDLPGHVKDCDYIISGEGQLDESSIDGKVIQGLVELCKQHSKSMSLFVGVNSLTPEHLPKEIDYVSSIMDVAHSKDDAMLNGLGYLEKLAYSLAPRLLKIKYQSF